MRRNDCNLFTSARRSIQFRMIAQRNYVMMDIRMNGQTGSNKKKSEKKNNEKQWLSINKDEMRFFFNLSDFNWISNYQQMKHSIRSTAITDHKYNSLVVSHCVFMGCMRSNVPFGLWRWRSPDHGWPAPGFLLLPLLLLCAPILYRLYLAGFAFNDVAPPQWFSIGMDFSSDWIIGCWSIAIDVAAAPLPLPQSLSQSNPWLILPSIDAVPFRFFTNWKPFSVLSPRLWLKLQRGFVFSIFFDWPATSFHLRWNVSSIACSIFTSSPTSESKSKSKPNVLRAHGPVLSSTMFNVCAFYSSKGTRNRKRWTVNFIGYFHTLELPYQFPLKMDLSDEYQCKLHHCALHAICKRKTPEEMIKQIKHTIDLEQNQKKRN